MLIVTQQVLWTLYHLMYFTDETNAKVPFYLYLQCFVDMNLHNTKFFDKHRGNSLFFEMVQWENYCKTCAMAVPLFLDISPY